MHSFSFDIALDFDRAGFNLYELATLISSLWSSKFDNVMYNYMYHNYT